MTITLQNNMTANRSYPRGEKLVKNVSVTTIEMDNGTIIQVNEFGDGEWDVWYVNSEQTETYCMAASHSLPQKNFNE